MYHRVVVVRSCCCFTNTTNKRKTKRYIKATAFQSAVSAAAVTAVAAVVTGLSLSSSTGATAAAASFVIHEQSSNTISTSSFGRVYCSSSSSRSRGSFTSNTSSQTVTDMVRTTLDEHGAKGELLRREAAWRNWISKEPDSKFPAEPGRYHLYVSYACPWAHRTLMVRALKGLEDIISVTVVHPTWQRTRPNDPNDTHTGWIFGTGTTDTSTTTSSSSTTSFLTNSAGNGGPFPTSYPDTFPDPLSKNSLTIRDVYDRCNDVDGKYSVPILYDKIQDTIVSNESSDIIRMFNTEFNKYATNPELDLYPSNLRTVIDEVNGWVYPTINNGVYRCGFAKTQIAYDEAIKELTTSFDRIDTILQTNKYITGDTFTEADIRLFVTLLRFDEVYTVYFKTNTRSVADTPSMLRYMRDIYNIHPNIPSTINMEHIKTHYFTSHPLLNHYSIIPAGKDFEALLKNEEKPASNL